MSDREYLGRAYTAPDITVYFDVRRCIHFAACVRGLPQVFDRDARPWIRADGAPAEQIAEIVRRCPTGALHYELRDGPAEEPDATVTIAPQPDGPLFVRGDIVIQAGDREVRGARAALCRCGQSGNKPFCDGTHAKVGWRSGDAEASG
ncbi:MAG TPA: (4Fe-4S)-binding protein [Thermomicrobiales bacterium]|nr:(4Fe-4S)-binding protein [Thermomicrobiales bacterium]